MLGVFGSMSCAVPCRLLSGVVVAALGRADAVADVSANIFERRDESVAQVAEAYHGVIAAAHEPEGAIWHMMSDATRPIIQSADEVRQRFARQPGQFAPGAGAL